jgi:hypothetical protein
MDGVYAPSHDSSVAGAPEDEVTSAMIDAGVELFYDLPELLGPSNKELRDTVKRVFLLMLQMHREHRNVA